MKKINWGFVATTASVLMTGLTLVANIASQKQQQEDITKEVAKAFANLTKED